MICANSDTVGKAACCELWGSCRRFRGFSVERWERSLSTLLLLNRHRQGKTRKMQGGYVEVLSGICKIRLCEGISICLLFLQKTKRGAHGYDLASSFFHMIISLFLS